jgi:hypothetical protein
MTMPADLCVTLVPTRDAGRQAHSLIVAGRRAGEGQDQRVEAERVFVLGSGAEAWARLTIDRTARATPGEAEFTPRAYTVLRGPALDSVRGRSIVLVLGDLVARFRFVGPRGPIALALYPGWGSLYAALELWLRSPHRVQVLRISAIDPGRRADAHPL